MLEARIKAELSGDRPYLILEKMKGIRALLDSGALCPVWVRDEKQLVESFGARACGECVRFTVFGGKEITGTLYEVPLFTLAETLFFTNLPVIAAKDASEDDTAILLPATMFKGMVVTLDPLKDEMLLKILDGQPSRRLKVTDKDGDIRILTVT